MATAMALGAASDSVVRLISGGAPNLAQLSDDELLANTRRLVGKTNQLLAALLIHLAEVETRGVHRTRSCASLYTYCIYELRFSEDAAARRSMAARFVKQFPALLDAVSGGELHLTGLLMIGPHLTPENHLDVIRRARFRTKKELAKLVRELNPLPSLADRVEPLGPEQAVSLRRTTWAEFVDRHCVNGRELPEGERPRDWVSDAPGEGDLEVNSEGGGAIGNGDEAALPVGPVPADLPPITSPQQYGLQFSTVEEHVKLIEKAKALLAQQQPHITLGELHLEAMKVFVASLEKQKFAVTAKPWKLTAGHPQPLQRGATDPETTTQPVTRLQPDPFPVLRLEPEPEPELEPPLQRGPAASRSPSRYIPADTQREVYERDGGRCAYVDARGERCHEARFLQIHHLKAFAKKGGHHASNLALHCAAHNALAAEQDFGKEEIAARRDSARHESLRRQI